MIPGNDTTSGKSARLHLFYRYANAAAAGEKVKIAGATKGVCLRNCAAFFGAERVTVFADRVDESCVEELRSVGVAVVPVDEGSGGGNFRQAGVAAMELADDAIIYMVEDDFLHLPRSPEAIVDGLSLGAEYVTLYDHPDKYLHRGIGGNPHVKHGGERTRLLCGKVCHWKITNSTVMTFATTAGQLRRDWPLFLKYCGGRYTDDYRLFRALAWRGRRLISAVPGLATHCETAFLSPFTDWAAVAAVASNANGAT